MRTVILHFSTDGVQLFRNGKIEVWPFLVLNLNLPSDERYCTLIFCLIPRYNAENFLSFGLCPGLKQPKDLDSFLIPFLKELEALHIGIQAYDAHIKSSFLLKAHLIMLSGDTSGISKLLHLTGHIGKRPCRACKIQRTSYKFISIIKKGTRRGQSRENTSQYYPLFPPTNAGAARPPSLQSYRIQIANLPRRITENYIHDGEASSDISVCATESGVKGISPFVRLKIISVPESAPFDVIHLVYLGLMQHLCGLMNGKFFKSAALNE